MGVRIQRKQLRHGIALAALGEGGDEVVQAVSNPLPVGLVDRPHQFLEAERGIALGIA
ncbi:hypothetical protein D9M68_848570 [compost metagenome]